jgi:hypothetical protein
VNITVYQGSGTTGSELSNICHTVADGTTAFLESLAFNCTGLITVVTTSFNSNGGQCSGNVCQTRTVVGPGSPGVVLPVYLSTFIAERNGNTVSLKWTSEAEVNLKEYSVEMNDGTGFKTVGSVLAKQGALTNYYSFEYNYLSKHSVQFRLRLVDIDGSFTYSKTALVKGDAQSFDFSIYPNPSTSANTNILISGLSSSGRIQIIDITGKVLKTLVVNSNNVKVGHLPTGVYMVKLSNTATAEQVTKRLIIVN